MITKALSIITIFLFAGLTDFVKTADNQPKKEEFCCCKFQDPISNPSSAATNYSWETKKDCKDIYAGTCTNSTKEECGKKKPK